VTEICFPRRKTRRSAIGLHTGAAITPLLFRSLAAAFVDVIHVNANRDALNPIGPKIIMNMCLGSMPTGAGNETQPNKSCSFLSRIPYSPCGME
jgi:hypothetical protein